LFRLNCGASPEIGVSSYGLQGIADSVDRLDQTMQQNAALVEEGAAAASSLKSQAAVLTELVGKFHFR